MASEITVEVKDAKAHLLRLHTEIEKYATKTLQLCIEAGQFLHQVKGFLPHGEFLSWVRDEMPFSIRTAQRYMKLFFHQSKIVSLTNLTEAYRLIRRIEAEKRIAEEEKARERVEHYSATGEKGEGWRRGTDHNLSKRMRREQEQEDDQDEDQEENDQRLYQRSWFQELQDRFNTQIFIAERRKRLKAETGISQRGMADPFMNELIEYLLNIKDPNQRLEAASDIVKLSRTIRSMTEAGTIRDYLAESEMVLS